MPKPTGLLVAMPTRGQVTIETMLCLQEHLDGYPHRLKVVARKPVTEASNELFAWARDIDMDALDFDPYVLTVADDAWWPSGTVARAVKLLDANPDVDILSSVCSKRGPYLPPTVVGWDHELIDLMRYKPGELIQPLRFASLHWSLIRPTRIFGLLDDDEPFNPTVLEERTLFGETPATMKIPVSEDHAFCYRAIRNGAKLATERSLIVGHVEPSTGQIFFPHRPAMVANGAETPRVETEYERGADRFYFTDSDTTFLSQNVVFEADNGAEVTIRNPEREGLVRQPKRPA